MRPAIVILAAGSGTRFGHSTNKVWLPLGGKAVITRTISNAHEAFPNAPLVLVINQDDETMAREILQREIPDIPISITYGGSTRHGSEYKALLHLENSISAVEIDLVLIHDGARPLATPNLYRKIAEVASKSGGAIPTTTIDPNEIDISHEKRIVKVQTPQGFIAKELLEAYLLAEVDGFTGTDTGACVEKYFPAIRAKAVEAEISNIKITYAEDLALAEVLLTQGF